MAYILKLQLRDTRREFATTSGRDIAYDMVLDDLIALGVPEGNIILSKIDTQHSAFLDQEVEKVVSISQ